MLHGCLSELTQALTSDTTFTGVIEQTGRMLTIQIQDATGEHTLRVGTVVQIGPVWRILEPAVAR
ncbi:MAG: hypothetical protein ACI8RZ_002965 [Myxococcota bacterium]|jgi:hypothetical protein